MRRVMVRYTVKPEAAEANERLVRDVYEELGRLRPDGFHYGTFKLDDGVTFVHLATHDSDHNPLPEVAAFRRFQEGLGERCAVAPVLTELEEVGSFRFAGAAS
jgi:hypothetical protein